jgi:hypothetical protein
MSAEKCILSEDYMLQNNKNVRLKCMVGEICGGRGEATRESISSNPCSVTCLQIVKHFPFGLQLIVTEITFQLLILYASKCTLLLQRRSEAVSKRKVETGVA